MYTTKCTRRKTKKKQPPEVRSRDGHVEHVHVCKVQGPSVNNGVDIWTIVRKTRHPLLLLFVGVIMIRNTW